jgi:glycosyltransferase involved in cell wall biosynthesis
MLASNYYPINDVSSIRIHSYCKALVKVGVKVTVLIIYPSKLNDLPNEGVFEGVHFKFITNGNLYLKGRFQKLYSRLSGLNTIRRLIRKERPEAILSYHDNLLSNLSLRLFLDKKIPFIVDKTEYPYGYFSMSKFRKFITDWQLSLFSAFIVISKELFRFYAKYSNNIFLLPMTIDPNRFENIIKENKVEPYIALTFGTHNRDGLFDSIIAFNEYVKIVGEEKAMKLVLIGDFKKLSEKFPECERIMEYISTHSLEKFVDFKGLVAIQDVPQVLINASCLITTPSKFESGGFPTKLGEYMLSGVPVVATSAGEISEYVRDRHDIFLCEVGDLESIANNILFIQDNKEFSRHVALNAIITAQTKFNADTYARKLLDFIKENGK